MTKGKESIESSSLLYQTHQLLFKHKLKLDHYARGKLFNYSPKQGKKNPW